MYLNIDIGCFWKQANINIGLFLKKKGPKKACLTNHRWGHSPDTCLSPASGCRPWASCTTCPPGVSASPAWPAADMPHQALANIQTEQVSTLPLNTPSQRRGEPTIQPECECLLHSIRGWMEGAPKRGLTQVAEAADSLWTLALDRAWHGRAALARHRWDQNRLAEGGTNAR